MKLYAGPRNSFSSLNAIVFYTYRIRFKYYWNVDTLHTVSIAPFFNTKPYLEREMSVCRTQSKAQLQSKTVSNSIMRPTVFISRTPWNYASQINACSWILTRLLVKQSKLSWRHFQWFFFSYQSEDHISSSGRKS